MGTTLTGQFETRREAEMAVERLVQEHKIERTDIFIVATGKDNTAGEEISGSDSASGEPSSGSRDDAVLNGAIEVSVDIADEDQADVIRAAFDEFSAHDVEQD